MATTYSSASNEVTDSLGRVTYEPTIVAVIEEAAQADYGQELANLTAVGYQVKGTTHDGANYIATMLKPGSMNIFYD